MKKVDNIGNLAALRNIFITNVIYLVYNLDIKKSIKYLIKKDALIFFFIFIFHKIMEMKMNLNTYYDKKNLLFFEILSHL